MDKLLAQQHPFDPAMSEVCNVIIRDLILTHRVQVQ